MRTRPYSRPNRFGNELRKLLSEIISRELDTSKVGFATVTTVKMTNDLKIAKVYISVLDTGQKDKEIETFFNSRAKFLRGRLGSHLTSKSIPELKFFYDDTYEEAEKIDRLIAKIQPQRMVK
ncbi:MAG TPA: 30S ribosome-binding factor RbfA [Candidatus Marinimicrobia bacterium]|nr:30S ribosome-binding factor RbfA [Candidatus Neomarinimicrobiota bacterium]HIB70592.1 30S ribosome-binding factor RbfA [Candidatus Neomarinimicrobiota bacterium]HIO36069.1 30S ribosome-binding factor RbfA [Candidatus Neomarinimicrobiota bacterium]